MAARGILDSYRKELSASQKSAAEGAERAGHAAGRSAEAAPLPGSEDAPCLAECVTELTSRADTPC